MANLALGGSVPSRSSLGSFVRNDQQHNNPSCAAGRDFAVQLNPFNTYTHLVNNSLISMRSASFFFEFFAKTLAKSACNLEWRSS